MKWLMDGLWGTPTRTKRVFEMEMEAESESTRKRALVAINDVEAALSRLREVIETDATHTFTRNLKHETPPLAITEASNSAGNEVVGKANLNELR